MKGDYTPMLFIRMCCAQSCPGLANVGCLQRNVWRVARARTEVPSLQKLQSDNSRSLIKPFFAFAQQNEHAFASLVNVQLLPVRCVCCCYAGPIICPTPSPMQASNTSCRSLKAHPAQHSVGIADIFQLCQSPSWNPATPPCFQKAKVRKR